MGAVGGGLAYNQPLKGMVPLLNALSNDPRIAVIRVGEPGVRYWLRGHEDDVVALAFSPTAPVLASVSSDKTLRLWRVGD